MNETAARNVLLVRAAEATGEVVSDEDRGYAERTAAELVRWQSADRGTRPSAEAFIAKRAELLAQKLVDRNPRIRRILDATRFRPWIGIALPLIALALGALLDRVTDPGRINVLAFPLLGLIVWNLAIYVVLLARTINSAVRRGRRRPGWEARLLAGARIRGALSASGPLAAALARFAADWTERSAPLIAARAGRILHISAAALALGAVAGLFVRGLVFEYRAGWESTFLRADSVHALITLFLGPAAALTGQPLPTHEEIVALRWSEAGGGENAARWIYLYTAAVATVVIVPRLLLGVSAWLRERRLTNHFPLGLDDAYFRRVLAHWREAPAHVRVQPYAYTADERAAQGVQRLAANLFGDSVQVYWARPIAFGGEDSMSPAETAAAAPSELVLALFNASSTPEPENHGVFLDKLRSFTRATLVMLIDEGPYRERLGGGAGAEPRIGERRHAWKAFATTRSMPAVFADLASGDVAAAQAELDNHLVGSTATP